MQNTPFISTPLIERKINELIDQEMLSEAIQLISHTSLELALNSEQVGNNIYIPIIDNLIEKIAKIIFKEKNNQPHKGDYQIILTTELYDTGGHSRIVEELASIFENPIVICTGYLGNKDRLNTINAISKLPILALPNDSLLNNIDRLYNLCRRMGDSIFILTHHQDALGIAGTCLINNMPVYFIHHSDHRPSIGTTVRNYIHVDMAQHMHTTCKKWLEPILDHKVEYWPQGVKDYGEKKFENSLANINTATSGNWIKFSWDDEISLPNIISTILNSSPNNHYHIGNLPDDKLTLVRNKLALNGIDPRRFINIQKVPSLWKALIELPIGIFIGSAPINGLRTAIEVQGAGIPIIPHKNNQYSMLDDEEFYHSNCLQWKSVEEIPFLIQKIKNEHRDYSKLARHHYATNFSVDAMKNSIYQSLLSKGKRDE